VKNTDDYIAGRHNYWLHFSLGAVMGAAIGFWIGSNIFESHVAILLTLLITSVIVAFSCGRWGDRAWYWIIHRLPWLT
jgi:uncharacterized membrane protein YoaK (UPF0700 family)